MVPKTIFLELPFWGLLAVVAIVPRLRSWIITASVMVIEGALLHWDVGQSKFFLPPDDGGFLVPWLFRSLIVGIFLPTIIAQAGGRAKLPREVQIFSAIYLWVSLWMVADGHGPLIMWIAYIAGMLYFISIPILIGLGFGLYWLGKLEKERSSE